MILWQCLGVDFLSSATAMKSIFRAATTEDLGVAVHRVGDWLVIDDGSELSWCPHRSGPGSELWAPCRVCLVVFRGVFDLFYGFSSFFNCFSMVFLHFCLLFVGFWMRFSVGGARAGGGTAAPGLPGEGGGAEE